MADKSGYFDLGDYSRPVTTREPEAQVWFDRGLIWAYGFNHAEAVACFRRALDADADCAMAWWGIAYASGPNYNKPWDDFDSEDLAQSVRVAYEAAERASRLSAGATAVEQALIDALARRCPSPVPNDDMGVWDRDWAAAMRKVYRSHPDDPDVQALFAEALMNLTPWALWDLKTGRIADGANAAEAIDVLESGMRARESNGGDLHAGLLHMYIHLMEMSPHPERALGACERLRDAVPDAGHLRHMPTHIDVLCGDYASVVRTNEAAIAADRKYLAHEGAANFYSLYRCHNFHFKIYGAMFLGQFAPALDAAEELAASLPADLLAMKSPPMADWLEGFVPMKMHVLIRFGRWNDILDLELPGDRELFCVTTAMTRYAKAVANAVIGDVEAAEREAAAFEKALGLVPGSRYVFNNSCRDILAVAREMMHGEIAYRTGDLETAFKRLRRSVDLDDSLAYDEPWGWMQPTRHALGALLLEQGRVDEAAAVYRADLGYDATLSRACQHPDNVWSLHGYLECLESLGRADEAAIVRPRLAIAMARADVPITASCFCRNST
ncbi:MAG: hypothetical protein OXH79_21820 [Boseongicola sp.]|nr:hypothetical protein [Boseongicola sp.]